MVNIWRLFYCTKRNSIVFLKPMLDNHIHFINNYELGSYCLSNIQAIIISYRFQDKVFNCLGCTTSLLDSQVGGRLLKSVSKQQLMV
ncbi:hypothetical protein BpHYR1_013709 [Brachionus plicatilis]|uniref:Uncharacterized protein n=1 Tax=Brachionus plicatilis TaxID=10195 RepID=A0A3M7QDU7_BRAPC|nr:hypothetical protein BpHYR1_013709 [Brachionus plicatilis]